MSDWEAARVLAFLGELTIPSDIGEHKWSLGSRKVLPSCFPYASQFASTEMAIVRFTEKTLAKIALPAGRAEMLVWDDDLPGFGVRLRSGGKRTWVAQYRLGSKHLALHVRHTSEPEAG